MRHNFEWYKGDDLDRERMCGEKPRKPVQPAKMDSIEKIDDYREKLVRYQNEMEKWQPAFDSYMNAVGERANQFNEDLKEEFWDPMWMTDQTWEILYNKAYEDGHAYGFEEIYNHMSNLMAFVDELLLTVKRTS